MKSKSFSGVYSFSSEVVGENFSRFFCTKCFVSTWAFYKKIFASVLTVSQTTVAPESCPAVTVKYAQIQIIFQRIRECSNKYCGDGLTITDELCIMLS